MHAKLLNYIGQVFECKADNPHYYAQGIVSRRSGTFRRKECDWCHTKTPAAMCRAIHAGLVPLA